jgi:NhaA family Na+:H+ antiporter
MSLFINNLAFRSAVLQDETKLGVLAGSLLSALAGWAVLALAAKRQRTEETAPTP